MTRIALVLLGAMICAAQSPPSLPLQLFNGKDLTGWRMVGPGQFIVENGLLKTEGGMGLLYYEGRKFGDAVVRVVFKTTNPTDNSGVIIRLPEPPPDPWYGVHNGYEVQIDAAGDEWHGTGSIYSLSKLTKRAQKPAGEWNTMEIELDGPKTRISLNGELVNEFPSSAAVPERKEWYEPVRGSRPDYGYIGLQNHHRGSDVYFKEVTIAPRPGSASLSQGERDRLLSHLHGTRKQLLDAVATLSPKQWTFKQSLTRWSIAEIVEHLAATEEFLANHAREAIRNGTAAPEKKRTNEEVMAGMRDRTKKANAPGEIQPSGRWTGGDALMQVFETRRDENLNWIRVTQQDLIGRYSPSGMNAYQLMLAIGSHTERHLAQIEEVRADANFPR